jgi:hypothetical protein
MRVNSQTIARCRRSPNRWAAVAHLVSVFNRSSRCPADKISSSSNSARNHAGDSNYDIDYSRYDENGGGKSPVQTPSKISSSYDDDDEDDGVSSGDGFSAVRGRHGRRQDGDSHSEAATAYHVINDGGRYPAEKLPLDDSSFGISGGRSAMRSGVTVGSHLHMRRPTMTASNYLTATVVCAFVMYRLNAEYR